MIKNMKWNRLVGDEINDLFSTIESDIRDVRVGGEELRFYVGTDSQVKKKITTYVTAVVLYRVGSGALVYYARQNEKTMDMRSRLWNETYKAVEIAKELNGFLRAYGLKVHEVHADLNSNDIHKSNSSVQACLGYICGMGFKGKIKPYAWASSCVANKKTKGGRGVKNTAV